MRATTLIFGLALAAVAALGIAHISAQPAPQRTPSPTAVAVASPRVVALGRLEPVSEVVRVGGPAGQDAARLVEVRVKEGDWVERGDIVAVLDTRERMRAALGQAEATLELRRAALARARADLDNQEQTLLAALEQQRAQRDRARWDLERLRRLQQSGLYQETALIDRQLALTSAERVLASAQLALDRVRARDARGLRFEEASAIAEVGTAEAALERARVDLSMVEIKAPIAGRVLRRLGRGGEQISNEGILELGDTRVMMARLEVFESDIASVGIGQTVQIVSRAFEGAVTGQVERVGLKVNRQSVVGEDPASALDARVVEVVARLDDAASARLAGFTGLQVRATFVPRAGS